MIVRRKIKKALKNLNRKANLNNKDEATQPTDTTATQRGRSSRTGQEPHGTCTDSPGENEEICYITLEGSTQAVKATSTLDMSVSAVIIRDYPPEQNVHKQIQKEWKLEGFC